MGALYISSTKRVGRCERGCFDRSGRFLCLFRSEAAAAAATIASVRSRPTLTAATLVDRSVRVAKATGSWRASHADLDAMRLRVIVSTHNSRHATASHTTTH